jgi:ubiquinone/menaquinone biosynthesis C-methylase UbiE/predicted DNA-binding protein (MmcQ/YjbR family)
MPSPAAALAALRNAIKTFALSLPGTSPKSPWPGHDDVAVSDKTFVYLGSDDQERLSLGVKLRVSGAEVLRLPGAMPMAYGLGKSGWVSIALAPAAAPPLEMLRHWVMESYRAQAPKRLLKALETAQPWVAAGALPATAQIRFDDGAAYEEFMGRWSRLAGDVFLDWLAPAPGLRWLDVGCGNGAFTERLVERCAPAEVEGIDPSVEQIAHARAHAPAGANVAYRVADAMRLPYGDRRFDAAVMALVIFFVPDPPKSVAEMARVVRPGGGVCTYAWDLFDGGFPYAALQQEIERLGFPRILPPSAEASRIEALRALWAGAGLVDIETHEIAVERTFADFATFWRVAQTGPRLAPVFAKMTEETRVRLEARMRERLPADAAGRVTYGARAHAIRGRRPG